MTDFGFEGDAYPPKTSRRIRRGKQALVGLAGLAALAAGGLFFVTEAMPATDQIVPELGAAAPARSASPTPVRVPPAGSPHATPVRPPSRRAKPSPSVSRPVKSGVAPRRSPVPFMSPSMSLAQRIVIVRAGGDPAAVPSAVPQRVGAAMVAQDISVTDSGSIKREGATLRVVSAFGDLTGQRELAWVADAGEPVGDAHCSQNFYYRAGALMGANPALMVCWRTSPAKSVFTVAVSATGRPSAQSGVAALNRRWARMGPAPMPSF